jgi:hypothetical protein
MLERVLAWTWGEHSHLLVADAQAQVCTAPEPRGCFLDVDGCAALGYRLRRAPKPDPARPGRLDRVHPAWPDRAPRRP